MFISFNNVNFRASMLKFIVSIFSIFVIINYGICKPSQEIVSLDSNVYKYFAIKKVDLKNVNGRIYKIQIALPLQNLSRLDSNLENLKVIESRIFNSSQNLTLKRKKIVYLLDGNSFFPRFLNLILKDIESNLDSKILLDLPVVIGVGHDSNLAFDRNLREIDYTPKSHIESNYDIEMFHYFLTQILKPYFSQVIESRTLDSNLSLGKKPYINILFGHSFGGLYTLYNAFYYPRDFEIYFAASPSLYLNNGAIFPTFAPFLHDFNNRTLIISQGSLERASSVHFSRENLYNMLLLENPQNDIRFYDFYGKTHGESIKPSFLRLIKILKDL